MKPTHILTAFLICMYAGVYAQQWGDYTLYSVQNTTTTQLLDTNRNTVKTWTHTGYRTGYSSYLAPGGYLYKTISKTGNSFTGGPICGQLIKMDWNGNILWNYTYSTTEYCSHHDFHVMPNGNVLLIAYERHSATEVADAGGSFTGEMWAEHVAEIKQTGPTSGEVVWKWRIWDHLVQNVNSSKANYQTSIVDHPELLNINYKAAKDWIHMNGIDYNPILDQIVVSSHNLNEWWVIDHSTTTEEAAGHTGGNSGKGGDILYRWGNPAAYGASGTTILNVTHDSHWIPEGVPNAGRLVGFNNKGVSSTKSAVDQILPPATGYTYSITPGQAFEPATYLERHAANGYTSNMGNSHQLPNGNMLVCLATAGTIYELNPSGATLWTKTFTGMISQAFKYNKCYVENEPPAIPEITASGNVLTASAAQTYQWYRNGSAITGATSKTYNAADSGVYVVRITDSLGCVYRYSGGYKHLSGGGSTGVLDLKQKHNWQVFPNPTTGKIQLTSDWPADFKITVRDLTGKVIQQIENQFQFELSDVSGGLYFVTIATSDSKQQTVKIQLIK